MSNEIVSDLSVDSGAMSLSSYLKTARGRLKLSLRAVEEATDNEISNGYLSQLENGKISKPSPHILHCLSEVYGVDYSDLMRRAGHIAPVVDRGEGAKHGRAATLAVENLNEEEQTELLKYLEFIRSKHKD